MAKNDWTSNLIIWVLGFSLVVTVLAVIGFWYILLAALATAIVIFGLMQKKRDRVERDQLLQFDRALELPVSVTGLEAETPFSEGPTRVEVDLVELDRYKSNWDQFKLDAQVARAGTVRVHGLIVCFQSSGAERGILLAHHGRVLGEVRQLDLPIYFESLWDQGGRVRAGCHFRFDSKLEIQKASFEIQVYNSYNGEEAPRSDPAGMWLTAWRILTGRDR